MKWRVYQVACFVNSACVVAILLTICYFFFLGTARVNWIALLFFIFGIAAVIKNSISNQYFKIYHQNSFFNGSNKALFWLLYVLHCLSTLVMLYAVSDLYKGFRLLGSKPTYVFIFAGVSVFCLSSLMTLPLDIVLMNKLKHQADLSRGLLEQEEESH